jgi:hypothetical protein
MIELTSGIFISSFIRFWEIVVFFIVTVVDDGIHPSSKLKLFDLFGKGVDNFGIDVM